MSDVGIRRAESADARALALLLAELGYPCDAPEIPSRLDAMAAEGSAALLATDATGQGIGLVCVSAHATLHSSRPVAYIMALVVSSAARGLGVGRALVEAAERWARERGCAKLSVTSAEHREDAHAFYPSVDMPYTGRRFAKSLVD